MGSARIDRIGEGVDRRGVSRASELTEPERRTVVTGELAVGGRCQEPSAALIAVPGSIS